MDLSKLTALEAGKLIKNREISVTEITKAALDNIDKTDKNYKAFVTVCPVSYTHLDVYKRQKFNFYIVENMQK